MAVSKKSTRLLLVDDEVEFLEAMEPGLVRRGFDVTLASDGRAALDLLSSHAFDVIVLDVKMPVLDGVDTFREVKRLRPGLPVIMLTGHGNLQQAFETSREGVYEYLTKPCQVEDLARVVTEAVSQAKQAGQAVPVPEEEIRLLLVDDDRDFVDSVAPALGRRGIAVSRAYTGESALEQAGRGCHDVAVVDVRMPDIDGLTLLDRLRETDPQLEVIVLTGHPTAHDARRGFKHGAFDFLVKPQRIEELVAAIRRAHEHRRKRLQSDRAKEIDEILERRPD